jgi:membrane associated rhomboid family serine protease
VGLPQHAFGAGNSIGPGPRWPRSIRFWSTTKWLIAINVAVFLLDVFSGRRLSQWGAFSADRAIYHAQLWRWITYQFLHVDPYHIGFNMIGLWIFAPGVEARLSRRRFIGFYLLSGIGGVLGYLILWRMNLLDVTRETELIGASASIFGVLMAAAWLSPNTLLRFFWPPITLRFVTVAWIYIGLAVVNIFSHGFNAGGEAAHLGGAVVGFVLIRNVGWLNLPGVRTRRQRFWQPGDPASNFFRKDVSCDPNSPEEQRPTSTRS